MDSITSGADVEAGGRVAMTDRPQPLTSTAPVSGLVFIMSGPSGVGKDTITTRLKEDGFPLGYCVTATTRNQRPGEVHGVHYYFLTDDEFTRLLEREGFLEHAIVHGKRYGIPIEGVRAGLRTGNDVWITPDVQGAATLREKLRNAITIFLAPPKLSDLLPRLMRRGSEGPEELALRLKNAEREMQRVGEFDYLIVNEQDRIDETVDKVKAIITAERARVRRRTVTL